MHAYLQICSCLLGCTYVCIYTYMHTYRYAAVSSAVHMCAYIHTCILTDMQLSPRLDLMYPATHLKEHVGLCTVQVMIMLCTVQIFLNSTSSHTLERTGWALHSIGHDHALHSTNHDCEKDLLSLATHLNEQVGLSTV